MRHRIRRALAHMAAFVTILTGPATSLAINELKTPLLNSQRAEQAEGNVLSILCPSLNTLKVEDMIWSAPGSWKSYNPSFTKEVVGFYGAEWVGAQVGSTICLYAGNNVDAFPVDIQNNSIFLKPSNGRWKKISDGRYKCQSTNRYDCPLQLMVPKRQQQDYRDLVLSLEKQD